jgi:hypothetical protein
MDKEMKEAKRRPCPGCLLYHQTELKNVDSIKKFGLLGYRGADSLILRTGETDEVSRGVLKADAYLEYDMLCSHRNAVFFYNDLDKIRKDSPYVVVDMRDLDEIQCRVESSIQELWEDLVACCGEYSDDECTEEDMEKLAGYYCQSFMQHPCGNDLLELMADNPTYRPKIPETTRLGEDRQVMVYCDIPPEIIRVVMPGVKE